jgi:hypothetical protein
MELLENITIGAGKIQEFALDDFKKNARISRENFYAIKDRDYILVSFSDNNSIIYMIDVSNFYLSGYMWKNGTTYSCLCCSDGDVIAHSFDKDVRLYDITTNDLMPCKPETYSSKVESIKKTLDKVSFSLCESVRFEAIREYFCYKGWDTIRAEDLKILTNNWKVFNYSYHISLKYSFDTIENHTISDPNYKQNTLYNFMKYKLGYPLSSSSK